jgi:hypothetical protein
MARLHHTGIAMHSRAAGVWVVVAQCDGYRNARPVTSLRPTFVERASVRITLISCMTTLVPL